MSVAQAKSEYVTTHFGVGRYDPSSGIAQSLVTAVKTARTCESADGYPAIVASLNDRWRIIDSCEPFPHRQWILQHCRTLNPDHPRPWSGQSFCQTRSGLEQAVAAKVDGSMVSRLWHLPARIR